MADRHPWRKGRATGGEKQVLDLGVPSDVMSVLKS
jgi:hypothetical protein